MRAVALGACAMLANIEIGPNLTAVLVAALNVIAAVIVAKRKPRR